MVNKHEIIIKIKIDYKKRKHRDEFKLRREILEAVAEGESKRKESPDNENTKGVKREGKTAGCK